MVDALEKDLAGALRTGGTFQKGAPHLTDVGVS